MKARLTLLRENDKKPITKIYDWDDFIITDAGNMKVCKLSLHDHKVILDGAEHVILSMFSKTTFDEDEDANTNKNYC